MTAIAYFDCPSGAAGDMILAACLDAGLPLDHLRTELAKLALPGWELKTDRVMKQHLAATHFEVVIAPQHHHRHFSDIRAMIEESGLTPGVRETAVAVFRKLAVVEGRMHGMDPEEVHFHEVGAVDSIIDVVGAAVARDYFRWDRVVVSPLPLGGGFIDTAHGRLPLPAPATLALLEGVPTYGVDIQAELVTPTGAAVLTALADRFGPRPAMTVRATGMGAGTRDLPGRPNVLRLSIGESTDAHLVERLVVAETNIDDMNPEIYPFLVDKLLARGALDAWLTPIQMKKGRPAVTLSFLAPPERLDDLAGLLFSESTTLGLRTHEVDRRSLPREARTVETPWGPVRVKAIRRPGREEIVPEYEACRQIAERAGVPIREVYEAANRNAPKPKPEQLE